MGQESNWPKAAQKFSCSLLHLPEDDLGSEERKKDFQGDGTGRKGISFFGSCPVLEIEYWTL